MVQWEQPGSHGGFLGLWARGSREFPSALIGLVLPLGTRKAEGNLCCRCFPDCICIVHNEILLYFPMFPRWSGGKETLACITATKSIFFRLYMRTCKGEPMAKVYFHIGGLLKQAALCRGWTLLGAEAPPLPTKRTLGPGCRI